MRSRRGHRGGPGQPRGAAVRKGLRAHSHAYSIAIARPTRRHPRPPKTGRSPRLHHAATHGSGTVVTPKQARPHEARAPTAPYFGMAEPCRPLLPTTRTGRPALRRTLEEKPAPKMRTYHGRRWPPVTIRPAPVSLPSLMTSLSGFPSL